MIYRSNLRCPDLSPRFAHLHLWPGAFHHEYPSDWADKAPDDPFFGTYRKCGFWTHDEVALLYNIAQQRPGRWLDIGAHTGWTASHLAEAGCEVTAIEPLLLNREVCERFRQNTAACNGRIRLAPMLSETYRSEDEDLLYRGVVIDAAHDRPHPLEDAQIAYARQAEVILFHDAIGGPVWDGIYWLLDRGYRCKMFFTPQMVACCWNNEGMWAPPMHVCDPIMHQVRTNHMKDFNWSRVE